MNLRNIAANFCAFGLKTNRDWNLMRKFWNLHIEISMENWHFIHFLSHLPRPLSFYTALENNTIFLQPFFLFRVEGSFPLPPAGAPVVVISLSPIYEARYLLSFPCMTLNLFLHVHIARIQFVDPGRALTFKN